MCDHPPLGRDGGSAAERQQAIDTLYRHGMTVRREVVGNKYVEGALQSSNQGSISAPTQEYITAACWGGVWARENGVLTRRERSLMNLSMLCCLNRSIELATHVKGALNNGVTEQEIAEVMLHVCVYAGAPAGMEGCRVAERAIQEWKREQLHSQSGGQDERATV